MNLSFTRAAFLDKALEDLSVVLENRLVGGRFWLPASRKSRSAASGRGSTIRFAASSAAAGRSATISSISVSPPSMFAGPEIVQATPRAAAARIVWNGADSRLAAARRSRRDRRRRSTRAGRGARSSFARRRWRARSACRSRRETSRTSRASIGSKVSRSARAVEAIRHGVSAAGARAIWNRRSSGEGSGALTGSRAERSAFDCLVERLSRRGRRRRSDRAS